MLIFALIVGHSHINFFLLGEGLDPSVIPRFLIAEGVYGTLLLLFHNC